MLCGSENAPCETRRFFWNRTLLFFCLAWGLILAACQTQRPLASTPTTAVKQPSASATLTLSPSLTTTLMVTPTGYVASGTQPVWQDYAAPTIPPATAVPPPFTRIDLPEDVQVLLLLGSDENPPYEGSTDGIVLALVNPRLAKASLVSVPGDLFVYIPGYTMQRINVAYPVGGLPLLFKTLEYNFGLHPDHWALVHPDDFQRFVDELGGLDVSVLVPVKDQCGSFEPGEVHMDGAQAMCYVRIRQGSDEIDRNRRLQQVLRLLFLRMVQGGNLARLPDLFATYQPSIRIDLTLEDMVKLIPLALKLGDPQRVSYYQVGWDEVTFWQLPGQSKSPVLLPRREPLLTLLQQAVDAVSSPSPLSDRVTTMEYELTISPTPSSSPVPSLTPTVTVTPFISTTPTRTPTITLTPTISQTPTISATPTVSPTPTETQTLTP